MNQEFYHTELSNIETGFADVCVYLHINPETQEIFYVGLGVKDRPYNRNQYGRSDEWFEYAKSICFNHTVIILYKNLTYTEAGIIEKQLIKKIGRKDKGLGTLLNKSDGGEGNNTNTITLLKQIIVLEEYVDKLFLIEKDIIKKASECESKEEFKYKHKEDYDLAIKLDILDKVWIFLETETNKEKIKLKEIEEMNFFTERIRHEKLRKAELKAIANEKRKQILEKKLEKEEHKKVLEDRTIKLFNEEYILQENEVKSYSFLFTKPTGDKHVDEVFFKTKKYLAEYQKLTGKILDEEPEVFQEDF